MQLFSLVQCSKKRVFLPSVRSSRHNRHMSLDTIIHASLVRPARRTTALVLMGGGARTAYQVGVLRALGSILQTQADSPKYFPFQVLVGTSAGAINAACLASYATQGLDAFERLAQFWSELESSGVYRLNSPRWTRFNKLVAAWSLSRHARSNGAILDNQPLVETLRRAVSLPGVEESLRTRAIDAFAVTASSYTSGVHWTFVTPPMMGPTALGRAQGVAPSSSRLASTIWWHPAQFHFCFRPPACLLMGVTSISVMAACARFPPCHRRCIWAPKKCSSWG